ncbi:cytochrome P450 [Cyathus striatus]|nr:cytochrome P450 [Cyathus striatus]
MILLLLESFCLLGIACVGWKYIRLHVFKSPLDNVPGPPSTSFLKGNFANVFNMNGWDFHKEIAARYGSVIRIKTLLGENQLYVFDPKAMHHIMIKDQNIFEETDLFITVNHISNIYANLNIYLGDHHKKQRKLLNPVFSIAHLREMGADVDVTAWMSRAALELLGQSGLGYSFDPLMEHGTPHPLLPTQMPLFQLYILPKIISLGTPEFRRWLVDIIPSTILHKVKDIADLMHDTSVEILRSKREALEDGDGAVLRQVARGKDIMSILRPLSENELLGQMTSLIFAGMDTTSSALSHVLYILSIHTDAQEKHRQEIRAARTDHGELTYDDLVSLPYLDAVCRETLRLYPPVSQISRIARQDIGLPLTNPIKGLDGSDIHEILVPKGTYIHVSILSANSNPDIWGRDASEWRPERWLNPLPQTVKNAHIPGIYSPLMTFIGGSRACIGFKYAQLEMSELFLQCSSIPSSFLPRIKISFWAMAGITAPTVVGEDQ